MLSWRAGWLLCCSLLPLPGAECPPDAREFPLPSAAAAAGTEEWVGEPGRRSVRGAIRPALHYFAADPACADGSALVLAPGGGFHAVVMEREGWAVARRLAAAGVAVWVLKYRLESLSAAVEDARDALRLVRSRASGLGLDPGRVGFGGFSAGGRVALALVLQPSADAAGGASDAPPDFLMLVYPSPLAWLGPDRTVGSGFPPTFLAGAAEDDPPGRVYDLAARLQAARVRHEVHVFGAGSHGFDLAEGLVGTSRWPDLFLSWLRDQFQPGGGMRADPLPQPPLPRGRAVGP